MTLQPWRVRHRRPSDGGFTLTEALVVMVLFAIVGAIVTTASVSGLRHQTQLQDRSGALAQARTALERIDRDIRSANPLLSASSSQIAMQVVEPTKTRTVTYSVSGTQLIVRESDKSTAGITTTSSKVLLPNLVSTSTNPVFSVSPVVGYVARSGSGVTATTCAMSGGYDPGCIGTITVHVMVQPSTSRAPVSVSDNGTELRNAP